MASHCDTSAMKVVDNDKRLLNLLKVNGSTGHVKGKSHCSKFNAQIKNNLQRLTVNKDRPTMVADIEVTYERKRLMLAKLKFYLSIIACMLSMLYVLIFMYTFMMPYTVGVVLPNEQSNEQLQPALIEMDLTEIVVMKVKDKAICKMKLAHPDHSDTGDSRSHGASQEPEKHSTPTVSEHTLTHSDTQHKVKMTPKFCRHSLPHFNTQHEATTPTFSGHPLAHSGTQRKVKMISKFCGHPLPHSNTQRKVRTHTFSGDPLAHSDTQREVATPESTVEITVSVMNETTAPEHNKSEPATIHHPRVRRDLDSQTIFEWIGSEISDGKVFRDFFNALHDSYETLKEKLSNVKNHIRIDERNELQDESKTGKRVARSAGLPVRNGRYSEPVGDDFNGQVQFYPQPQEAVENHSKDNVADNEQTAAASPVITFQVAPPRKSSVIMLVMNMFLPNGMNKNNYPVFVNIGQKQPTITEAKTSTKDHAAKQSERKTVKVSRNEQPVRDQDWETTLPTWATEDRKVKEGRDAKMGNKKELLGDGLASHLHYHMATTTTWSPEEDRQVNMFDEEVDWVDTTRTTEDWLISEERESSRFVSEVVTPMTNIDEIIRNNIDETLVPKQEKATTPKAAEEHFEKEFLDIDLLHSMDTMLLVPDGNRQRLLVESSLPLKRNTRMVESKSLRFSDDLTKDGTKRDELRGKSVEKEDHKGAVRSVSRAENETKSDGPHGKSVKKAGHKWTVLSVGRQSKNGAKSDGPHGNSVEKEEQKGAVRSAGRAENGPKSDGPHGKSIKMAGSKEVVQTAGRAGNDVKERRVFETAASQNNLPAVPEKPATDVGSSGAIFNAENPKEDGKVTRQMRNFPKYPWQI